MNYKKIISYQEAQLVVRRNRNLQSETVIKTGCFDFPHIGHIKRFQLLQQEYDNLIVCVGSDRFVEQYKAKPAFSEKTRAEWIAAIEYVDYVVILDEGPEHWQATIDHVKFLTDVRPDYYSIPKDDRSLQQKQQLADRLGIKLVLEEEQIHIDINGVNTEIHSSSLKQLICQ